MMSVYDAMRHYERRGKHRAKKTIEAQLSNHMEMLVGAIAQDRTPAVACEFVQKQWVHLGLNAEQREVSDFGESEEESTSEECSSSFVETLSCLSITNTGKVAENSIEEITEIHASRTAQGPAHPQ